MHVAADAVMTAHEPVLLGPTEELFWRFELTTPGAFRVQVLLWLDGCIEQAPLGEALVRLQSRHPKLRARVTPRGDGRHQFEFGGVSQIPFEVRDCAGEIPWRSEAERQMYVPFASGAPLAAVLVLRNRTANGSLLIFSVHHAIADGMSGLAAARDLLEEYAVVLQHGDAAPVQEPLVAAPAARVPQPPLRDRLWLVSRFVRLQLRLKRRGFTPIPRAGADTTAQWVHRVFSSAETLRLVRNCRREGTSLSGALIAAALCSLGEALQQPQASFLCHFPFDMRPALAGAGASIGSHDLGSFVGTMSALVDVRAGASFWEVAKRTHVEIQSFVKHGGPSLVYNTAASVPNPALGRTLNRMLDRDRRATLLATHYGVAALATSYGPLTVRGCTLNFRNDRLGAQLVIEGVVLGQELNVGFAAAALDPAYWPAVEAGVYERLHAAAT